MLTAQLSGCLETVLLDFSATVLLDLLYDDLLVAKTYSNTVAEKSSNTTVANKSSNTVSKLPESCAVNTGSLLNQC